MEKVGETTVEAVAGIWIWETLGLPLFESWKEGCDENWYIWGLIICGEDVEGNWIWEILVGSRFASELAELSEWEPFDLSLWFIDGDNVGELIIWRDRDNSWDCCSGSSCWEAYCGPLLYCWA